jgi:hypothetical protein
MDASGAFKLAHSIADLPTVGLEAAADALVQWP